MPPIPASAPRPAKPLADANLLQLVLDALRAKGRLPCKPPVIDHPTYLRLANMESLYLEQHPGGWVANIGFRNVPKGMPNTIGTSDAAPLPTREAAFMIGAALVCGIATGSCELPFFVAGDQLICVAH